MLNRVGRVLGWTGDIGSALLVAFGLAKYFHLYDWTMAKLTGEHRCVQPRAERAA